MKHERIEHGKYIILCDYVIDYIWSHLKSHFHKYIKKIKIKINSFQETLFQKPANEILKVLQRFELGLPDSASEVLTISWF